jgi:hypothetical protein
LDIAVRDRLSLFQILQRDQNIVAGIKFEDVWHGEGKILNDEAARKSNP